MRNTNEILVIYKNIKNNFSIKYVRSYNYEFFLKRPRNEDPSI